MLRGKMPRQISGTADSCVLLSSGIQCERRRDERAGSTLNDLIWALVRPILDALNKGQLRAPDELKEGVKALEE